MLMFKIAFRNIFRQKRRTILTVLTILGGCGLSVISIGWSDGAYNYIINMFTRNRLGHIQVNNKAYVEKPSLYDAIDNYAAAGGKIAAVKGVQAWAPRLYSAGLASAGDKSAGARIIGIDPGQEEKATRFSKKIVEGKTLPEAPAQQAVLGAGLARVLKVKPGDEVVLLSQGADGSIANDLYTVAGIAKSGDETTDRAALYLNIYDAQRLLVMEGRAHEIIVIVDKIGRVRQQAAAIARALADPTLAVRPWQEFARSFYDAMRIDQKGTWITLFIIVLIVAVSVLNTVLMSVLERRREYGLLKAMGTRPGGIVTMVLYEVNLLALIGIVLGAIVGSAVNYYLSIHGVKFSYAFTYGGMDFSTMYGEVNARSIYIPAIAILITATIVGLFPAVHAAHTEPAATMRKQ